MNLVKAYDLAKSLKIPQLIPYSNGLNPEVLPPYVALAEIQAQEAANKRLAAAEGASTGDMPSIKEKYEQAAGLMALQGQQQQQAQQQMTSQIAQAPQAVPQGVPQPQQQPTPPMMAEGGLARLSVNPRMFDYRAGGIISFQSQGDVPESDEDKEKKQTEADRAAIAQLLKSIKGGSEYAGRAIADIASIIPRGLVGAYDTAVVRPIKAAGINASYLSPMLTPKGADADSATPFTDIARQRDAAATAQQAPSATRETGDMGARDRGLASLPTAQPTPQPAPAARPVAPAVQAAPAVTPPAAAPLVSPGLPSVAPSRYEQMQMDALNERIEPITVAQAKAERDEATPELLRTPAGLEQLARLKQQQDQYEEGKKSRPMENWMRGLASAARGGIGGFGTSYIETAEGNRAADAAQADYQNKVMTAVDAMRRGEATDQQKYLLDTVAKGRSAADEDTRNRRSNITSARGAESQREIANLDRASREKIAEIDRNMRERHYLNPISAPSEKERFVNDFVKAGMSRKDAIERVMGLDTREGIAGDRINAAQKKILFEDARYMQAQKTLLDPNKSASEKAKAQITIDVAEQALGIPPKSSQPTMTPAQKAALEKYGAK